MHPLRDADGENYQNLRNKWFTIGEVGIKRKTTQARYRNKRKKRFDREFDSARYFLDTETDYDAQILAP